jgi:hypothetical protein
MLFRSLSQIKVSHNTIYLSRANTKHVAPWRLYKNGFVPATGIILHTSSSTVIITECTPILTDKGYILGKNVLPEMKLVSCVNNTNTPIVNRVEKLNSSAAYARIYVPGYHSLVLNEIYIIGDDTISQKLLKEDEVKKEHKNKRNDDLKKILDEIKKQGYHRYYNV